MAAPSTPPRGLPGSFVSDRAICNLTYAAHHATILAEIAGDPRLATYMASVREGLVFYLRPHRELLAADGVRAGLEWEEVVRIDGMVKLLLELFAVPYVPVESLAMQERTRLFERVLDLAGLQPKTERVRHLSPPAATLVPHAPRPRGERNGNGERQVAATSS